MDLPGIDPREVVRRADYAICHRRPSALRGAVRRITAYRSCGVPGGMQVETAALVVPLIFTFEAGFDIAIGRAPGASDRIASFAAGLGTRPVMIATPAPVACLQIDFTPLGALRAFGPVLGEMTERMVPLDALGDAAITRLGARLGALDDWAARLDLAEAWVAARLAALPAPATPLGRALQLIEASGGRVRVERLAAHVGWTRRHLAARFREASGLSPKTIARIGRFSRAEALARAVPNPDWAGIAAACGYADQSHLIRDFAAFAGTSPSRWNTA